MLAKFSKDPFALFKYNASSFVCYAVIALLLGWLLHPTHLPFVYWFMVLLIPIALPIFSLSVVGSIGFVLAAFASGPQAFSPIYWGLVPVGLLLGIISASLMHSAAHGSIRPIWLGRVVGELCGLQQLVGFQEWTLAHHIHHRYADDAVQDPHPPLDFSFWKYGLRMKFAIANKFTFYYFQAWGKTPRASKIWLLTGPFIALNCYMRSLIWLFFLGPLGFIFFFLPSYFSNMVFYAHFNYYTHRPMANGNYEILNLDHNALYRALNAVTFGAYYHKNHHLKPYLFNPKYVKQQEAVRAARFVPSPEQA